MNFLKLIFICSCDNMTFVAICNLHRIVGTILTTENSVHNREQYIKFSLWPGIIVRSRSVCWCFSLASWSRSEIFVELNDTCIMYFKKNTEKKEKKEKKKKSREKVVAEMLGEVWLKFLLSSILANWKKAVLLYVQLHCHYACIVAYFNHNLIVL